MSTTPNWEKTWQIASDPAEGKVVIDEIKLKFHAFGWPSSDWFGVHLAIEEALINAIKHGNQYDPNKVVEISCRIDATMLRIEVGDQGQGFDLTAVPDCNDPENLEHCSGRGTLLMRSFMRIEYVPPGNRVIMCKERDLAATA